MKGIKQNNNFCDFMKTFFCMVPVLQFQSEMSIYVQQYFFISI